MDPLHPQRESDNEQRDWSELNSDLLHLVSRKLPDLFDFVRFRVVCKHWRFAAPTPNHQTLRPCLFTGSSDNFFLYSFHSGKTYQIDFSNTLHNICVPKPICLYLFCGPIAHHILVGTISPDTLTLINPLTKNKLILPPLDHKFCEYTWTRVITYKVSEHVVITGFEKHTHSQYLALYRHDDGKWVTIRKEYCGMYPIMYYKRMYYCFVNDTENTEVIDATLGELRSIIPSPQSRSSLSHSYITRYFIESSGELLLVYKFMKFPLYTGCDFEIYRLNRENDELRWVKVIEIADQALFLNFSGGFSVRTIGFDLFKDNCIYYFDRPDISEEKSSSTQAIYVWKYDMKDGCREKLPYSSSYAVWMLPSLR